MTDTLAIIIGYVTLAVGSATVLIALVSLALSHLDRALTSSRRIANLTAAVLDYQLSKRKARKWRP